MILIVAEKPSVAKAISKWLGVIKRRDSHIECRDSYVVTWLFGHLLEQFMPKDYNTKYQFWSFDHLPIIPSPFKLKIKKDPGALKQFNAVIELARAASELINAGDPDREGQLLYDEIFAYANIHKPTKRLWLNSVDQKSIAKAFDKLEDNTNYLNFKISAETRQRADWLIGINFTAAFTLLFKSRGYDGVVSIGRVQTPTLKLIVDRDIECNKFKTQVFYNLYGVFGSTPGFSARLNLAHKLNLKPRYKGFVPKLNTMANAYQLVPVLGKSNNKTCPACGSQLITNKGKFGKFISCSKFLMGCKFTEGLSNVRK